MKQYLRWSLHQFFLIYYQPSRFRREAEGIGRDTAKRSWQERLPYLLKMLPWMILFTVIGNLLVGHSYEQSGVHYRWLASWGGIAVGMMVGIVAGAAAGIALGGAWGVTIGMAAGVTLGVAGDKAWSGGASFEVGIMVGLVASIVWGVVGGVRKGTTGDVIAGLAWGGIEGGVVGGVLAVVMVPVGGLGSIIEGVFAFIVFQFLFPLTYFRLAAYPLDVCLALFAWATRKGRGGTLRAWRLCPLSWNEVIWLPLPYATQLLIQLTREDRAEGRRQLAFVAAERPLQRRVALAALAEIVLGDLQADTLPALETTPERLQWAANAPLALPKAFGAAWPGFDRAARHVGQYGALHNAFRKGEALQRALQEVEGLQVTLIGTPGRFAVRLLQTANAWHGLLEREQATLQAQIEAVREIPNPFVFGNAIPEVEQQVFIGRQDIAQQIERSILGATHAPMLLLHGPRRMGKTSILNQLPRLLGNDFAPATLDCQNPAITESTATLLRYLSRTLCDGLQRRRVAIEPLTAEALAREPFAAFDSWLDTVERVLPPNLRALLCLDEYERLQEILDAGWGAKTLDMLRHTLQHRPRLVLMFTGAHTFADLGPEWTDRFISARRIRVSFLTPDEVRPLLTKPLPAFDMNYAPDALEAMLHTTNGQPFLTQAVAFELVEHLNQKQRKQATRDDVEAAISAALRSGGEYFANVWSDAKPEGQAILRAVARGETPADFPEARLWLRNHDVLTETGDFAVPLVQRWVQENA